jgi:hypothetical protein
MKEQLIQVALRQAVTAFDDGEWASGLEWLSSVPSELKPKDRLFEAHAALAKEAVARAAWGAANEHIEQALAIRSDPLLQRRLPLVRKAEPLLDEERWAFLREKADPALRLPPDHLSPDVTGTYACGAYHAWTDRFMPWSTFVRLAKDARRDTEEGRAALRIASEFMCRVVFEETPLLRTVDVVVAVPANPARYVRRMVSLPDELARALESHFALPFLFEGLVSEAPDDLELRGLSWRERREAVRGSMRVGNLGVGSGRSVLLVDDITTSGSTLREAARVLRDGGASEVFAITLSHTEG